jgi:hypothetical protein
MALDNAAGTGRAAADAPMDEVDYATHHAADNRFPDAGTPAQAREAGPPAAPVTGGAAAVAYPAGAAVAWTAAALAASHVASWNPAMLTAAHTMPKEQLVELFLSVGELGSAGVDWLKLDVVRDFAQTAALFFASIFSKPLQLAKAVWGNITNVIALDLGFVFRINPLPIYITLLTLASLVMLAFLIFMCMSLCTTHDAIREGHEHRTWSRKAKDNRCRVTTMKVILFMAASAYLPVSKVVLEVFTCHPQFGSFLRVEGGGSACTTSAEVDGDSLGYVCDCGSVFNYSSFVTACAFAFALFTVGFPIVATYLVWQNRPRGSPEDAAIRYDADGHPQPYTDKMYECVRRCPGGEGGGGGAEFAFRYQASHDVAPPRPRDRHRARRLDLATDPDQLACPYKSLYEGFPRRWACFKITMSFVKLLLVVPVIALWQNVVAQSVVCMVVVALFGAFTMRSRPFLSPVDNLMDTTGRATMFITLLLGLLGSDSVAPAGAVPISVIITLFHTVQGVIMVVGTLWGIKRTRLRLSSTFGLIQVRQRRASEVWGVPQPLGRATASGADGAQCVACCRGARSSPTRCCTRRAASARSWHPACGTCAPR